MIRDPLTEVISGLHIFVPVGDHRKMTIVAGFWLHHFVRVLPSIAPNQ